MSTGPDTERGITRDYLDIVIGRLENRMDQRFNALEARFTAIDTKINGLEAKINGSDAKVNGFEAKLNNQRTLIIVAIVGVVAQIINAWILHGH